MGQLMYSKCTHFLITCRLRRWSRDTYLYLLVTFTSYSSYSSSSSSSSSYSSSSSSSFSFSSNDYLTIFYNIQQKLWISFFSAYRQTNQQTFVPIEAPTRSLKRWSLRQVLPATTTLHCILKSHLEKNGKWTAVAWIQYLWTERVYEIKTPFYCKEMTSCGWGGWLWPIMLSR